MTLIEALFRAQLISEISRFNLGLPGAKLVNFSQHIDFQKSRFYQTQSIGIEQNYGRLNYEAASLIAELGSSLAHVFDQCLCVENDISQKTQRETNFISTFNGGELSKITFHPIK